MEKYIIIVYLLIGLILFFSRWEKVKSDILKQYEGERNIVSEMIINALNNVTFKILILVIMMFFWLPIGLYNNFKKIIIKEI